MFFNAYKYVRFQKMTVKLLGNGQSSSFEVIPSTKMIGKKKILMKVA